jgi:hypothetical protein
MYPDTYGGIKSHQRIRLTTQRGKQPTPYYCTGEIIQPNPPLAAINSLSGWVKPRSLMLRKKDETASVGYMPKFVEQTIWKSSWISRSISLDYSKGWFDVRKSLILPPEHQQTSASRVAHPEAVRIT